MGANAAFPLDIPPTLAGAPKFRFAGYTFDPESRLLSFGGETHRLQPKPAAVLYRLACHEGRVVTREELIAEVWKGNFYTGPRGLTHAIWELRRLLDKRAGDSAATGEAEAASLIQTISKSGYRLTAPITRQDLAIRPDPALEPTPPAVAPAPSGGYRWGAIALLCALAIAAAGWLRQSTPSASATAAPPVPLTTMDGLEDFPAFSPDRRHWAYTWERAGQPMRIRVADLQQSAAAALELVDGNATLQRPVWVDADHLAYMRTTDDGCRVILVDLRDQARREVTSCLAERGMQLMDASPDGRWLAVARPRADNGRIAIVLHRLSDGFERTLTQPPAGFGDSEIAWSRDGRRIAFLRTTTTAGDLHVVDVEEGGVARLTHDEAPVWSVAWLPGDRGLVWSSTRDGARALWQMSADGGTPRLYARIDSTRNLAALADGSGDIAASVSRFADQIEVYDVASGQRQRTIASRSRDMYGSACPDAEHVAFVSMRSGSVGLWFADGADAEPRPLPIPAGTPEPPACSPDGTQFAAALHPRGSARDVIVTGPLSGTAGSARVYDVGTNVSAVNWSADGRALIVARDDGSGSDLWRFDPATQRLTRLTDDHGIFGREAVVDGRSWLYYTRADAAGLWRRPLDASAAGIPAEKVAADLGEEDPGSWEVRDGALWWVRRDAGGDRLMRRRGSGEGEVVLTLPSGTLRTFDAFSLAGDDTVLVSVTGPRQADIVRIAAAER